MTFLKPLLMGVVVVMAVLGGWYVTYPYGCFALLLFFLFWGVIAASFIDLKMHERRCIRRCYIHPEGFAARWLLSPFAVSLFFLAVSFLMALSAFLAVIDFSWTIWAYLPMHAVIMLLLARGIGRLFSAQVQAAYLPLFAREWSINLSALFLVAVVFYVAYEGVVPAYLHTGLEETLRAATNSTRSLCTLSDRVLRFHRELEAIAWWFMQKESDMLSSELFRAGGWLLFLFYNSLAVLGINRFIAEVLYLIDGRGKE
ncbi:hypothetical protein [Hydrogenimonas urashimensis]|uniref:hypothetical protein n=1 Tax=Hydrogenimonas urashimensis TaxID=2740515 RepID=UPI001914ECB7|nr:hypothetical protein [Hydrogenimonas urashimensis]